MKALVTGANGFIGSHLTKLLIQQGHTVKAMVLKGTPLDNLNAVTCEIVYADITQPETLHGLLNDVDVVFHLAAMPSLAWTKKIFTVNYTGTENLLNEAVTAGVKRFVFMSSLVVHGFKNFTGADELTPVLTPGAFTRPYIASKIKCEELIAQYSNKLETVVIRPGFNIYGPNDRLASAQMLTHLRKQNPAPLINGGLARMGYVYVENLAYGLTCAGFHAKAPGNTFILCDYEPPYSTLRHLFEQYGEVLNTKVRTIYLPAALIRPFAFLADAFYFLFMKNKMPALSTYMIDAAATNLHFTAEKAVQQIDYKQQVSYNEGITRTVDWYLKNMVS